MTATTNNNTTMNISTNSVPSFELHFENIANGWVADEPRFHEIRKIWVVNTWNKNTFRTATWGLLNNRWTMCF